MWRVLQLCEKFNKNDRRIWPLLQIFDCGGRRIFLGFEAHEKRLMGLNCVPFCGLNFKCEIGGIKYLGKSKSYSTSTSSKGEEGFMVLPI